MNFRWHHSSLAVSSVDKASLFYRNVFAFKETFRVMGMTKEIAGVTGVENLSCDLVQLEHPQSPHVLELIAFFPDIRTHPSLQPIQVGMGHVSFVVEDLDTVIQLAKEHGGEILGAVTYFSEGKSVYCREPAGSFVELEELFAVQVL